MHLEGLKQMFRNLLSLNGGEKLEPAEIREGLKTAMKQLKNEDANVYAKAVEIIKEKANLTTTITNIINVIEDAQESSDVDNSAVDSTVDELDEKAQLKESLTGFEDYTEEDFYYSEANTQMISLLDSLVVYLEGFVNAADKDPYTFQGVNDINKIKDALENVKSAKKNISIALDDDMEESEIIEEADSATDTWDAIFKIAEPYIDETSKKYEMTDLYHVNLPSEAIEQIISIDPSYWSENDMINDAPSQGMFRAFLKEHPNFVGECYLVNPNERSDYRLEVVGIKAEDNAENKSTIEEFVRNCQEKDSDVIDPQEFFPIDGMIRAWWD